MDETLKPLVGIALQVAPVFAGMLAGPAGGAVATGLAKIIAPILGLSDDTPAAVAEAARARPDAVREAVRQVAADPDRLADMAALAAEETKRLAIVNETARVELASQDRFVRWARPANIWANAIVGLGGGIGIGAAILAAIFGHPEPLAAMPNIVGAIVVICGALAAVAGVSAWGRTQEKLAGVADAPATRIPPERKPK